MFLIIPVKAALQTIQTMELSANCRQTWSALAKVWHNGWGQAKAAHMV